MKFFSELFPVPTIFFIDECPKNYIIGYYKNVVFQTL